MGKSTLISNISVAASQLGKKTILVDADIAMADVGLILGLDVDGPTLQDTLADEIETSEAIYTGPKGLDVIPAAVSFHEVIKTNPEKLQDLTSELEKKYEIVFIDSPSGFGKASISSVKASDEIVLIVNPTMTSISDALRTKKIAKRFNKKIIGAIISKASGSEGEIPIEEVKSTIDLPILSIIPKNPKIKESGSVGSPILTKYPDSESSQTFINLAEKILKKGEEIDYQELAEKPLDKIKEIGKKKTINYRLLLETEKERKNRKKVKEWLEPKIGAEKKEKQEHAEKETIKEEKTSETDEKRTEAEVQTVEKGAVREEKETGLDKKKILVLAVLAIVAILVLLIGIGI